MMLLLAVVVGVMLWSSPAAAIRWDFDDGTTQGWSAKEGTIWGGSRELYLFPGEVEDGVWRITVSPDVVKGHYADPGVELISPTIGHDSGLFDHVRIRFRTVHDRPTVGTYSIEWTNEHNALFSGWDPAGDFVINRFGSLFEQIVYTTEWQEVVFDLAGQGDKIWEGVLKDIQLGFGLDRNETGTTRAADEVVGVFEVDWIELTGVEEMLQGELPPPDVEYYFRFEGGGLFAPPVFSPIAPGLGRLVGTRLGVLTDLDSDGDLDLFTVWENKQGTEVGWLMAINDGHGVLELKRIEAVIADESMGVAFDMIGADLTGDGQDEIVLYETSKGVEVWSINEDLQIEVLVQIADYWLGDVGDWDGDGKAELFVGKTVFEEGSTLDVWEVAQGVWTTEVVVATERHVLGQIGDVTGDGVLDALWTPIFERANTWIVGAWGSAFPHDDLRGEVFEFDEWRRPPLGVGDFDGDGQVDFLTEFIRDRIEGSKGLVLQRKGVGDHLEGEVLYDDRLFRRSPVLVRDLNADGVDDWVFIGGDRVSGFGVFIEWGGSVQPTQAGERHRLEGSGRYVLAGDMDNDGDVDLVVLDPIWGGVHLLKSSLAEQATAVVWSSGARPVQHRLGDSYPNPFNPSVVLPLALATDAERVSLVVYDVLGRRVRQVWQGPLGAGSHRLVWDGRDEAGRDVAAGVYVYRVEVDGQVAAKKTTKLP